MLGPPTGFGTIPGFHTPPLALSVLCIHRDMYPYTSLHVFMHTQMCVDV